MAGYLKAKIIGLGTIGFFMNKSNKKLQIRNSTAEFLIFTTQTEENSIEVMVVDDNVWLTQEMIATLYEKGRSTITEHLKNIF